MIFTIGHSTLPIDKFIERLQSHNIETLVDVRTIPKSRHNPQFNSEALSQSLTLANIGYRHEKGLGGLRHARKDSENLGWRNDSFRGYADYMQTPEFEQHLQALIESAADHRLAIMCAEAVPWRCHRSLIADALLAHGVVARHIVGQQDAKEHHLTPFAIVNGGQVRYPGPNLRLPL